MVPAFDTSVAPWLLLLFGGWLAATVSGAAGFGGALLLLPLLSWVLGAKAAVPVLTLAQLLGNLSRAGFGWREIRWKPALLFCAGAVPFSALGAFLFSAAPAPWLQRGIGVFLLLLVALRHTPFGARPVPEGWLAASGSGVGLLSALAGSAGPLGAAVFLSLQLPRAAYVATEAVTAVAMHLTKTAVYERFALLTPREWVVGLLLGVAMVLGSWTGKRLIERLDEKQFRTLVEFLLVIAAGALILSGK